MNPEQIEKDINNAHIHIYADGKHVICDIAGNSIILLAMIDQALTRIVEENDKASYDQALSALKMFHQKPNRVKNEVINKILGDL